MVAFIDTPFRIHSSHSKPCQRSSWYMADKSRPSSTVVNRRSFLSRAAVTSINLFALSHISPSEAKVDIDIERFGDKELKVSTINKVKQNVRNVLTQKPELLPYFFTLTLYDGLTFNPETLEGGPNGSLRLELDREQNAELREACEAIQGIQALQRQDMSFADTCAFAGAVAVEVTGGPRIVIQLGREDAAQPDPPSKSSLYITGASAADLRAAFDAAGLDGARDAVLFHGAVGSLNDIGQSRAKKLRESAISDSEDNDLDSAADLDDVTYGKVQSKKRGAVLVETNVSLLTLGGQKFGNSYLKAILNAKDKSKLSQRDMVILEDKDMRAQVQRYADNNSKFVNEAADLFQKISLLGSSFESMTFRD